MARSKDRNFGQAHPADLRNGERERDKRTRKYDDNYDGKYDDKYDENSDDNSEDKYDEKCDDKYDDKYVTHPPRSSPTPQSHLPPTEVIIHPLCLNQMSLWFTIMRFICAEWYKCISDLPNAFAILQMHLRPYKYICIWDLANAFEILQNLKR